MAVIVKWICDRDNTMFTNKKDAEAYDKMLELGEHFTNLLTTHIAGIDPQQAETFGILLAKNKEAVMEACKGNTEALEKLASSPSDDDRLPDNVTPLLAEAHA
ncbi:MAG: YebG family protein [Gammaproteobacteria bacterium]|nr:YebG family protein [Gammaproteobacteria bacterium]